MGDDLYGGTNRYFNKVAAKHGIDFKMVDVREPKNVEAALTPKTKLVWFEGCTNPLLRISDVEAIVQVVKAYNKDIVIVVDNTFLTPYNVVSLKFNSLFTHSHFTLPTAWEVNFRFFIRLSFSFQRYLDYGADCVMHSATKYMNGHSDVVMGLLTVKLRI